MLSVLANLGIKKSKTVAKSITAAAAKAQRRGERIFDHLIADVNRLSGQLWKLMDENNDKQVTKDEFIRNYLKSSLKLLHMGTLIQLSMQQSKKNLHGH